MPGCFISLQARKRISCLFFLLFGVFPSLTAQETEYFPFYEKDTARVYELAVAQRNSLKQHLAIPKSASKGYRESYEWIVNQSALNAFHRVRNLALLDTLLNPYLQSLFSEVKAGNKDLPASKLILTRSPVENAYALADGTIFFNVGLLARLENESQIAFILCHELAHVQLRHMEQGIKESLDARFSKDFKKQYNQVAGEKYNRFAKMKAFMEEKTIGSLYHRRSLEKQADSLGYLLLLKTRFAAEGAYSALQVLDKIDDPTLVPSLDLPRYFSCQDFSFDFRRQSNNSTSIFDVAPDQPAFAGNPDTLKTHPDCRKRMRYLKDLEQVFPANAGRQPGASGKLANLVAISRKEAVQGWYDSGNYDYALFQALLLLREQPESNYLKGMVALCLYALKWHMLQHRYAEMISPESQQYPESLNHLLRLLNTLNLSDFKKLSACVARSLPPAPENQEFAVASRFALAALQEDSPAAEALRKTYLANYKQGRFNDMLEAAASK